MRIYFVYLIILLSSLHGQQIWQSEEGPPVPFDSIAYGNGVLVGLTSEGLTYTSSDNGETWTMRSLGGARPVTWTSSSYAGISGIVFDGFSFCVAYKGFSAVSTDGLVWTIMKNDLSENGQLVYGASGLYLYVIQDLGASTVIYYSDNLMKWERVSSQGGWFRGFATDGATFYVSSARGGNHGVPLTAGYRSSTDGMNWQSVQADVSGGIHLLGYADGYFYCQASGYFRSVDGVNWNPIAFPSSAGEARGRVMELGGATVIATTNGFIRSEGSELFDFHHVPAIETWGVDSNIAADGRILLSPHDGGSIMISEDGQSVRYANESSAIAEYFEANGHPDWAPNLSHWRPIPNDEGDYLFTYVSPGDDISTSSVLFRLVGPTPSDWHAPAEQLEISGLASPNLVRHGSRYYGVFRDSTWGYYITKSCYSDNGLDWFSWQPIDGEAFPGNGSDVVNDTLFLIHSDRNFSVYSGGDFISISSPIDARGLAYGGGKYVILKNSNSTVLVSDDGLNFESYTQSTNASGIFFLNDNFIYTSTGRTLVSSNGISGVNHYQVFGPSGATCEMELHAQVSNEIFAEFNNPAPNANVTGSVLACSTDGISYAPTFGLHDAAFRNTGSRHKQNIVRVGDTYYGMTYRGTLMSAPVAADSPSEVELLSALPSRIDMTEGVETNLVLPMPGSAKTYIISDLPLGVGLNVATGEFSGVPEEENSFNAWIALVTDSRIVQKEVQFIVASSTQSLSLVSDNAIHSADPISDQVFSVSSNVSWSVETPDTWVTLQVDSGSGDGEVRYSLSRNASSLDRQGTITVSGDGITENFTVTQRGASGSTSESWYSGASNIQPSGWRYYDWFKGFKPEGPNWIYHGRHGWLYVLADDSSRMFLWDGALGRWMYTNATAYPWMYAYGADGGWVFFFEGGRPGSRYFKRGDNGQTISEQQLRANP